MTNKPTYEELEKQVKELHNKAFELREENKILQEQFDLSKIILSTTPDLLVLKDRDFLYQVVNQAFCEFLGKTEEDIVGKTDFDLFPRIEAEVYRRNDQKVIETGKPQIQDEKVTGEKEKRWLRVAKTPLFSKKGANMGVLCSVVDITDRKKTKELLRDSEERYRKVVESQAEMICRFLPDGTLSFVNEAYCRFFGKEREELVGQKFMPLIPETERDKILENIVSLDPNTPVITHEHRVLAPNGEKCWHKWTNRAIFDDKNNLLEYQAVGWDITERKQAENTLRESEERFRLIFENSSDGIMIANPETMEFLYVNPAICKILGYTEEELTQMSVVDIHPKESLEYVVSEFKAQAKGEKLLAMNIPFLKKNNTIIYMDTNSSILRMGEKIKIMGIFRDVTDRKLAEEALKKAHEELEDRVKERTLELLQANEALKNSEAALKSILSAVPIGIGVVCDRVITEANERLCEILGYSRGEILGNSARKFYPTDEDFEYVGHEKYTQIHEKGVGSVETRFRRKDGNVIDVFLSSAPIDKKNLSKGVTFTVLDVTDRKQADRDLRKSEQKYRLLVESTPDWVWICDEEGQQTFSNRAAKQILGYEIQEVLNTSAFKLMHPEDRKRVKKWFQNAKKQKRGWKGSVIRWQHKDKSLKFLETIAEPILDDQGNLTGFTGIDRDVTARKQSEEELKKAHNKLKKRTMDLEIKTKNLEETNIAMKILLQKREEDKKDIEHNILTNIKKLIDPYINKIRKTKLDSQQNAFLNIMESNLQEITSQFARKISLSELNLTPTELQIANMIRYGNSSKEIAGMMNISIRTVDAHRRNIRKKIGLTKKRSNLRSHLLSLH